MIGRLSAVALLAVMMAVLATRGLAEGQDHPPLTPTRDAVVEYRVQGTPGHAPVSVSVHASGGQLRVEPAGLPGYIIVDRGADRVMMVMDQPHVYFETPARSGPARDLMLDDKSLGFTRKGADRVAGLPCIVWDVQAPRGRTASICMTPDGILLRGAGRDPEYGSGSLEAVSVTYAPQPAALFRPPSGYRRMDIPRLSPELDAPR